jgi:hypothetical protein
MRLRFRGAAGSAAPGLLAGAVCRPFAVYVISLSRVATLAIPDVGQVVGSAWVEYAVGACVGPTVAEAGDRSWVKISARIDGLQVSEITAER